MVKVKAKKYSKYRGQRQRNLYDPFSTKPYRISRTKLELFSECKRCFYIDCRLGVGRPNKYSFSLNLAVDELLKKEFDIYRLEQKPHPICIENGIKAVPFKHKDMDRWRDSLHAGIEYIVPDTNLMICGGVDDIWIDSNTGELIVVEYKATSKSTPINLDNEWQIGYKRQVEIYQWLLRKNGFRVSDIAYFVYCNGKKDYSRFDKQLHFDIALLEYKASDFWVEKAVIEVYECLQTNSMPIETESCDHCRYLRDVQRHLLV